MQVNRRIKQIVKNIVIAVTISDTVYFTKEMTTHIHTLTVELCWCYSRGGLETEIAQGQKTDNLLPLCYQVQTIQNPEERGRTSQASRNVSVCDKVDRGRKVQDCVTADLPVVEKGSWEHFHRCKNRGGCHYNDSYTHTRLTTKSVRLIKNQRNHNLTRHISAKELSLSSQSIRRHRTIEYSWALVLTVAKLSGEANQSTLVCDVI